MDILKIYKEAYTKKEAAASGLPGTILKGGAMLGGKLGLALALGIPTALGLFSAAMASKIQDPTSEDLENVSRKAYIEELRARLNRVKELPSADNLYRENTLRI